MNQSPIFHKYLPAILLILLLAVAFSAAPQTFAQADTPTPTATATNPPSTAPQPTAVQPNVISNNVDTELVVTGSNFASGAVVVLEGYGALATTTVSANLLFGRKLGRSGSGSVSTGSTRYTPQLGHFNNPW